MKNKKKKEALFSIKTYLLITASCLNLLFIFYRTSMTIILATLQTNDSHMLPYKNSNKSCFTAQLFLFTKEFTLFVVMFFTSYGKLNATV